MFAGVHLQGAIIHGMEQVRSSCVRQVQHVKANHGDDRTLWGKLFAQEKNLTTSAIARMNLFLHGASDFQVVRGDTLRNPAFFLGDSLATFDCVIANPPFSLESAQCER